MTDIFISYSSKDKNIALKICAQLEAMKLKCWMAPRDIKPGEEYASGIIRGINNCRCMVIVFSDSSNASRHVLSEVESAFSKSKVIVPFKISEAMPTESMEYFLKVAHWLDASSESLDNAIVQLGKTVASILGQEITPPPRQSNKHKKRFPVVPFALIVATAVIISGYFILKDEGNVVPHQSVETCGEKLEKLVSINVHLLDDISKSNLASVNEISCLIPNREIKVNAWVEPDRSQFMAGDTVSFKVSLSQSAYLVVYVHSMDGSSYLIYPNDFDPESKMLNKDSVFTVGDGRSAFTLEIAEPFGLDVVQFVASTDELAFSEFMANLQSVGGTTISLAKRGNVETVVKRFRPRGLKVVQNQADAITNVPADSDSNIELWGEALILLNTKAAE